MQPACAQQLLPPQTGDQSGDTQLLQPEAKTNEAPNVSRTVGEEMGAREAVTVAQLTDIVKAAKGAHDRNVAKQIENLQLTERLSSPELARLREELPGEKSKAALMAIGDASAFLELAGSEILDKAAPSPTEQRQIVARAAEYLDKFVSKLPDFYATRFTTSFVEVSTPKHRGEYGPEVLHPAGKSRARVVYRNGKEVVRAEGAKERGLVTQGVFGPILGTVISDTLPRPTEWRRWEKGQNGPIAVFRFDVPQTKSHYRISFAENAMPLLGEPAKLTTYLAAYHGEIGIDPNTGTILRLVLWADPEEGSSLELADIMVEYEAVVIGGKVYRCPVHGISMSIGKARQEEVNCVSLNSCSILTPEIHFIRLEDLAFTGYHVFRSEMRILPD
jgi:hypothetical protein